MIRFAWVLEAENFDPSVHFRPDEDLFRVTLVQEEGKPAELTLVIANPHQAQRQLDHSYGILSYKSPSGEIHCLFRGKLVSREQAHREHFTSLTFTSCLLPLEEEWASFLEAHPGLKNHPFYDPFFHASPDAPEAVLASQPLCLYWDRVSGKLGLSHATKKGEGSLHWELNEGYNPKTLSYSQSPPLGEVQVQASAQWVQRLSGYMDLAPYIASHFHERIINTYTGKAFSKSWPKTGSALGQSGYRVLYSTLEEIEAPFRSFLKRHKQALSLSRPLSDPQSLWQNEREKVIAKRSWFEGELIIGWQYQQKRKETIRFNLKASLPPSLKETQSKEIHLGLQKITQFDDLPPFCPFAIYEPEQLAHFQGKIYRYKGAKNVCPYFEPTQWEEVLEKSLPFSLTVQDSFFTTPRGYEAFEYALECAKASLTWGSRCLEVQAEGGMEWARVTTHDVVTLKDPRLPKGQVQGKVTKYILFAEGENSPCVRLFFKSAVGIKAPPPEKKEPQPLYAEDYASPEAIVHEWTPADSRGFPYYRYDHAQPPDLFKARIYAHIGAMVDDIFIQNEASQQEAFLRELDLPAPHLLKGKETKVSVRFKRLAGQDCLSHTIQVELGQRWFDDE